MVSWWDAYVHKFYIHKSAHTNAHTRTQLDMRSWAFLAHPLNLEHYFIMHNPSLGPHITFCFYSYIIDIYVCGAWLHCSFLLSSYHVWQQIVGKVAFPELDFVLCFFNLGKIFQILWRQERQTVNLFSLHCTNFAAILVSRFWMFFAIVEKCHPLNFNEL